MIEFLYEKVINKKYLLNKIRDKVCKQQPNEKWSLFEMLKLKEQFVFGLVQIRYKLND
jgi:hypothetical protein